MSRATAQSLAAMGGRTRLIAMSCLTHDLVLWIAPNEDLDGAFWANCAETGDALQVNGWMFDLHDGAQDRLDLIAEGFADWRESGEA